MKGTLFSADFVKDSKDNLRLLELNTDTGIVENELSNLDLVDFCNILQTNDITELDIIYKPLIHSKIVSHISDYVTENCQFIVNINLHDENINTIYPTSIEDSNDKFILRMAYDESALFDSEYCKNRLNVYNLFTENSITDNCVAYYHSSSIGEFDTLTREINPSNIPDATIKDIDESYNPIDFFKINIETETIEENWNDFLNQNSEEDKLIEQYHFHSSSIDNNNHITSVRFMGIVYGSNLDFIELGSFKKSSVFELPSSIDLNSQTNKIEDYHFYEFVTNMFKSDSAGILSKHQVLMNDDTWKEISDIQVGEIVKSYYIGSSLQPESDLDSLSVNYDGNQFPSGSYITSSVVVFKDSKNLKYNSMLEIVVDGDSLFAGIDKGYLIYDSITDKSSFKISVQLNPETDYLYDLNGNLVKIDEVNFYVSSENELSFIELDVEDTDTYIINGSTAFNSLVTHNAPCFVEGTPILLEDGTYVNIENVKVGDRVLSFDFKNNESIGSNVLNIFSKRVNKVVKYKFESGKELVATEDHPIYVIGKGWTSYSDSLSNTLYNLEEPVKKIEIGDVIKLYNQTDILINTEILEGEYTVYNLSEVEKYHNYYANNVLSHNRGPVCFTFDTKITMEDGSKKNIGDIKIGDFVLSYKDGENVKGTVTDKLIHPMNSIVEVVKYNNMIADRLHPFYDNGEWKPIYQADGVELGVQYVDNFYNLEIDGDVLFESEHNFIVEDFVVSGLGDNELLNKTFKRQEFYQSSINAQ